LIRNQIKECCEQKARSQVPSGTQGRNGGRTIAFRRNDMPSPIVVMRHISEFFNDLTCQQKLALYDMLKNSGTKG
jgi:hypothetical protein